MSNCYIPVTGGAKTQLNTAYLDFVEESGYNSKIVSFNGWKNIEKIWNRQKPSNGDLLLLPGGGDIEPTQFGFDNADSNYYVNRFRDQFDMAAIDWALKHGVPIFGICRGLQLFFISQLAYSIGWFQHISGHVQPSDLGRNTPYHFVELLDDTLTKYQSEYQFATRGAKYMAVNSLHHQAIRSKLQNNNKSSYKFEVSDRNRSNLINKIKPVENQKWEDIKVHIHARKVNDRGIGIIEAASVYVVDASKTKSRQLFTGVQWHPEELAEHKDIIKTMLK